MKAVTVLDGLAFAIAHGLAQEAGLNRIARISSIEGAAMLVTSRRTRLASMVRFEGSACSDLMQEMDGDRHGD